MVKAALLFAAVILANPVLAQDVKVKERRGWYIGFGIGTGLGAGYKVGGDDITFDEWLEGMDTVSPQISVNFKVGGTISPKLLVGFDATALGQIGDDALGTAHLQINNYFAMATYFPFEKGLLLRAGTGLSAFVFDVDTPFGDVSETYPGFGVLLGVGYSFWLGRRFNLSLYLDHSRQVYNDPDGPDNSRSTMLYLGFDWY
jgi:hypothetical protein